MQGGYTSIFLRKRFDVGNISAVTNLLLSAQSDDGFIAWINGVEVARSATMPPGDVPYNGTAATTAQEPNNNGAAYLDYTLPDPNGYLVEGENVLAIHAFNQSLAQSQTSASTLRFILTWPIPRSWRRGFPASLRPLGHCSR
jgi:hypothetical protein